MLQIRWVKCYAALLGASVSQGATSDNVAVHLARLLEVLGWVWGASQGFQEGPKHV